MSNKNKNKTKQAEAPKAEQEQISPPAPEPTPAADTLPPPAPEAPPEAPAVEQETPIRFRRPNAVIIHSYESVSRRVALRVCEWMVRPEALYGEFLVVRPIAAPVFVMDKGGRPQTVLEADTVSVPFFEMNNESLEFMKRYVDRCAPVPGDWVIHVFRIEDTELFGMLASDKPIEIEK